MSEKLKSSGGKKPNKKLQLKKIYGEVLSSTKKTTKQQLKKLEKTIKKTKKKIDKTKRSAIKIYKKAEKYIKNPKKRKELIKALGIETVIDLYGNYKEKFDKEKERKRDEKESEKNKDLEDYKFDGERNAGEGEVMLSCQIMCVNTHAIAYNLKRTSKKTGKEYKYTNPLGKELKKLGITPNILKGSTSLFKNGVSDFETFKERIKILDSEEDLDNATEILSRSAIGKYQIIPRHHFDKITGWNENGNEFKLKMIFIYLKNEGSQNQLAKKIIQNSNKRWNGDPYVMAAAYYAGGRGGKIMKKYRDAIRNGEIQENTSLERKQAYGYGSIMEYAEKVVKYQKRYKQKYPDKSFNETFQMAIAKKESGYLRNKKIKV